MSTATLDLEQESIDLAEDVMLSEYLEVAFSNGFSKGTANVTPHDMQKLKPLLKYYAKKPHPFTACVRDNRKRFGPGVNGICAVVKDLIMQSTKWRNQGGHKAHLSEDQLAPFVIEEPLPEAFLSWVEEVTDEQMIAFADASMGTVPDQVQQGLVQDRNAHVVPDTEVVPANQVIPNDPGVPGGQSEEGDFTNAPPGEANYHYAEDPNKASCGVCQYFEDGICSRWGSRCDPHYVSDAFVFDATKGAAVGLSGDTILAEMFFEDGVESEDGKLLWKTILREGAWKYSPGEGQTPKRKPITVIRDGASDPANMVISMSEVLKNFQDGAVEHVQVPTRHQAGVLENTGFARDLRMVQDEHGKWALQAALDFTEPEVKGKAERGTIANTSAGILFNFIRKEDGKKFGAVLDHVALTNRPWLNGLQPFGAQLSGDPEDLESAGFVEDDEAAEFEGGEEMSETKEKETPQKTNAEIVAEELGLSLDEAKAAITERNELRKQSRAHEIEAKVGEWEKAKKTPALVVEGKRIMLADDGSTVLNLAEDSGTVSLTASDIVERLIAASPTVDLATDKVTDKDVSGDKPEDDPDKENAEVKLSQEEKRLAASLFLSGEAKTEEIAVALAKEKLGTDNKADKA